MAPSAVSRTASLKRAEFFAALLKLEEPRPNIVRDALHLVPDRQDARRFFRDREFHDGRSREEADKLRPHEERSEEHTSELQSLMRSSYAVFCLKKTKRTNPNTNE